MMAQSFMVTSQTTNAQDIEHQQVRYLQLQCQGG